MRAPLVVIAALGCLVGAQGLAWLAWQDRPVVQGREDGAPDAAGIGEVYNELEGGELAGTLMLGGMRGLVIDILWMRAVTAKDAGRFYESVALFELISKVQPRFEIVWNHMAWDMAYNIAAEVDDVESKWAWYLAGLEANARGVELNPQSEKILRHLAWLFFHKGEGFLDRCEEHDWRALIGDILARYGREDLLAPRGADQPPLNNFDVAVALYRSSTELAVGRGIHQPTFVLRLVPLGLEKSGNRHRNQGRNLAALRLYTDALRAWQRVLEQIEDPAYTVNEYQQEITLTSYLRNEGKLRRKLAHLAHSLAPDDRAAVAMAKAVHERDLPRIEKLRTEVPWRRRGRYGIAIHWYDEQ